MNTEIYRGYTIKIQQDDCTDSPRDWNNLGHMVYSHKNYVLGDEELEIDNFASWQEVRKWLIRERHAIVILPLRIYDHSGVSMSTTTEYPYNDRWDSSMIGYIYVTREEVYKEYNVKRLTRKVLDIVTSVLVSEVKTYDQYLTGDVYGYIVTDPQGDEGDELDSLWGMYGYEYTLQEAKDWIDYYIEHTKPKARDKSISRMTAIH